MAPFAAIKLLIRHMEILNRVIWILRNRFAPLYPNYTAVASHPPLKENLADRAGQSGAT
jgi:hypothetical protein